MLFKYFISLSVKPYNGPRGGYLPKPATEVWVWPKLFDSREACEAFMQAHGHQLFLQNIPGRTIVSAASTHVRVA